MGIWRLQLPRRRKRLKQRRKLSTQLSRDCRRHTRSFKRTRTKESRQSRTPDLVSCRLYSQLQRKRKMSFSQRSPAPVLAPGLGLMHAVATQSGVLQTEPPFCDLSKDAYNAVT